MDACTGPVGHCSAGSAASVAHHHTSITITHAPDSPTPRFFIGENIEGDGGIAN